MHRQQKQRGIQRGSLFGSGFPIGASSIPVGTRFSVGKSSVLYLCGADGSRNCSTPRKVWLQLRRSGGKGCPLRGGMSDRKRMAGGANMHCLPSLSSAEQRYNTLDFPTENRVPTGMLLAPIGNPEPKRLRPSGHPACPCSDYPSCSHTMDAPLPEQAKQAQRFARIAGRFLCLYLFSGGWTEPTKKPCRTLGLG